MVYIISRWQILTEEQQDKQEMSMPRGLYADLEWSAGHKPRRRLRKAAPLEAAKPVDSVAAVVDDDMADDIVVDLENPRQMREEEADDQDRGVKHREGVGLQAGVSNRQNGNEAEEEGAAPAGKPRKRLKKQVSLCVFGFE